MRCPNCQGLGSKVLDSRPVNDGRSIRRRRECETCLYRFTTFETIEEIPLIVVKKGDNRESFNREKLLNGLIKACEKRPVPLEKLEEIVNRIERELRSRGVSEVKSGDIGELVMDELAKVDEVAYVRFASVYRQFKDINVFISELQDLLKKARQ
ncbi:MAG: transcriptional regulator NrdR [Tuberibacillus sp.]